MVHYGFVIKHPTNVWYLDKHGRWVDSIVMAEVFNNRFDAQNVAYRNEGIAVRL